MKKLLSLGASAVYFPDELDPGTEAVVASYEAQDFSTMRQFEMPSVLADGAEAAVVDANIPGIEGSSLGGFLGIDANDLHAALASGDSLGEIAASLGVSRDELRGYLLQDYANELAAAVASESITADEAQVLFAAFVASLDLAIDGIPTNPEATGVDLSAHPDWIAWTVLDDVVVLPTE